MSLVMQEADRKGLHSVEDGRKMHHAWSETRPQSVHKQKCGTARTGDLRTHLPKISPWCTKRDKSPVTWSFPWS